MPAAGYLHKLESLVSQTGTKFKPTMHSQSQVMDCIYKMLTKQIRVSEFLCKYAHLQCITNFAILTITGTTTYVIVILNLKYVLWATWDCSLSPWLGNLEPKLKSLVGHPGIHILVPSSLMPRVFPNTN